MYTCVTRRLLVLDTDMPQWASAEGGGSEAESPDQMMLYYEDETSQYYDNKPDIADKIEQAGGTVIIIYIPVPRGSCLFSSRKSSLRK